jgi:hypothetical protein
MGRSLMGRQGERMTAQQASRYLYLCLYVQPQPLEPATFPGPCKRTGNRGWLAVSKTTTMHQRWLGDAGLFAVLDKLHRNGNARLAQCTAVR